MKIRIATLAVLLLASTPIWAKDPVLLMEAAPQDCQALGTVSIRTGGRWQGLFFSDARIRNNARKKLESRVRKEGGNRTVIQDKRVFLMDSHQRGVEHIEIDAGVWHCEASEDEPAQP